MAVKPVVHDETAKTHRPLGAGEKMDGLDASSILSSDSGNLLQSGSDGLAYVSGSGIADSSASNLIEATTQGRLSLTAARLAEWLDGHPQDAAALASELPIVSADAGNAVSAGTDGGAFLSGAGAASAISGAGADIGGASAAAAGTTALRTLSDRFGDFLNVKDFGAKGDGESDDTAAFRAAAASGRCVFVPEGSYVLSAFVDGCFFGFGGVSFPSSGRAPVRDASSLPEAAQASALPSQEGSLVFCVPNPNGYIDRWAVGAQGLCQHGDDYYVLKYSTGEIIKYRRSGWQALDYVGVSNPTGLIEHQSIDVDPSGLLIVPVIPYGEDYKQYIARTPWVDGGDLSLSRPIKIIPDGYSATVSPTACLSKDRRELVCTGIDGDGARVVLFYDYASLEDGTDASGSFFRKVALENWTDDGSDDTPLQGLAFDGTYIYAVTGRASARGNNIHYYVYDLQGRLVHADMACALGARFADAVYDPSHRGNFMREPEGLVWLQTPRGTELCMLMILGHAVYREDGETLDAGRRHVLALSFADSQMTLESLTLAGGAQAAPRLPVLFYSQEKEALALGRRPASQQTLVPDLFIKTNSYVSVSTATGNLNLSAPFGKSLVLYGHSPDYSAGSAAGRRAAVIVVAGQSNAAGIAESGEAIVSVPGCFWWDAVSGEWKTPVADPVYPSTTGGFVPALVQGLSSLRRSSDPEAERLPIYVVNVAVSASNCATSYYVDRLHNWGQYGSLRGRAFSIIASALAAIEEPYTVAGTVWLQGETDARLISEGLETQADYDATVLETASLFLGNLGGGFYVSEIGYYNGDTQYDSYCDAVNARLAAVAASLDGCHVVSELPPSFRAAGKMQSDSWHYTQAGYDALGADIAGNSYAFIEAALDAALEGGAGSSSYTFARFDAVYGMRINGDVYPSSYGLYACGKNGYLWKEVHALNLYSSDGTVQTSDERMKTSIAPVDEALMRAWGKVGFKVFQMKDAIAAKGAGAARLHVGVVAQQVRDAFASEGLDAHRYGLFCYDEWTESGEDGSSISGNGYGIRYSEALALECAYQRWLGERRDAEIEALKSRLQA